MRVSEEKLRRLLLQTMSVNDLAWKKLFDKYKIVDNIDKDGYFKISADQIREFREPRLMTKFDHKVNLPEVFIENELAILPISRGDYIISSFSAYKKFEELNSNYQKITIPNHLQSLMPQFIVSEAIALNCASACGVLNDFLEDDDIVPTVNGRMGSGIFGFNIDTKFGERYVGVENSQIEIDAAYEGINYLSLFEAKKDISEDFLIRQLYYPLRTWSAKISKPIKSIFMVFSNGVFNFYEYKFADLRNYNSLQLIKQKNYVIATEISISDIENLLKTLPITRETEISFPQANSMSRIINLIELLHEKNMTKQEITAEYAFDERQTNYYTDAGRYLELIEKSYDDDKNIKFSLSERGRYIMRLEYKARQLAIATQILKHKVFNEVLKLHLQYGEMPDTKTIVNIMKKSNLYNIEADSTYIRRSSTIVGWINWILGIID